jgi:hypothetical protein
MKVKIPYAADKEDFMPMIPDGAEWIITKNNELFARPDYDDTEYEIKESFILAGRAPYHTSNWLRYFCEVHHPEVDFDKDFETDRPGVYVRYEERFGRDYGEWVMEVKYNALRNELSKLGYELPWEIH